LKITNHKITLLGKMGLLPKFSKTKKLATFFSFIENYLEVGPTSPYLCTRKPQGAEAVKTSPKANRNRWRSAPKPLPFRSNPPPIPLPFQRMEQKQSRSGEEQEKTPRKRQEASNPNKSLFNP
jgi:hypothetical protein